MDGDPTLDVFIRDLEANTTTLVSRAPDGSPADGDSGDPALSAKAAKVVFESQATNLSATDLDATTDVFVHDLATATTTLVSGTGSAAGGDDSSFDPTVSNDGTPHRVRLRRRQPGGRRRRHRVTNVYSSLEPRFRLLTHVSTDCTSGSSRSPGRRRLVRSR